MKQTWVLCYSSTLPYYKVGNIDIFTFFSLESYNIKTEIP